MNAISFHARLRNRSTPMCIGNGREGNGRGMEAVVKIVCGVFISDRIRNSGYLPSPSFGFGQGRTR